MHLYETVTKDADLYPDRSDKSYGIHPIMKDEVKRLYNARTTTPFDVCVTLTANKTHNRMYEGINTLPSVRQVSKEIAKLMGDGENVYEKAMNKLQELKYDPLRKYGELDTIGFGYLLGDGSELNNFIASFTTIKLLKAISYSSVFITRAIYHIDATYKITKNHFPLIIIGRSDHNGTFHLISVSISSHEQEIDFKHILDSLIKLCKDLVDEFSPTDFLQDACKASSNAIA